MENEYHSIVEQYMALFQQVYQTTKSVDATIAILREVARDRRIANYGSHAANRVKQATPKQLALLQELKVECDSTISTREASRLIDDAIANKKKQD